MAEYDARIVVTIPNGPAGSVSPLLPWTPVIEGSNGQAGQTFHYQQGSYRIAGGQAHLWGYVQFSSLGAMTGALVLKGLPVPTALVPHPLGGVSSYLSNMHPTAPTQVWFRANGGQSFFWMDGSPNPGHNPLPLTVDDINPATQCIFYLCYPVD